MNILNHLHWMANDWSVVLYRGETRIQKENVNFYPAVTLLKIGNLVEAQLFIWPA